MSLLKLVGAVLALVVVLAAQPFDIAEAQDNAALLREVVTTIESDDSARYEELLTELRSLDLAIPPTILAAVIEGDIGLVTVGADLLESSDDALYERARDVIVSVQSFLPEGLANSGAGRPPPPPEEDRRVMRSLGLEGTAILETLEARGLEVPDNARTVLQFVPGEELGALGPRPVVFEAARRELAATLAARMEPTDTSRLPAMLVLGASIVGAALGAACIGYRRNTKNAHLAELAMTDGLTGLKNRRRLDFDLGMQRRNGVTPTGMLMIDIDHFKAFNDRYGHAVGDEVLRQVADVIALSLRADDVAYRYGGEEFCVLLPNTDDVSAKHVADRVRSAIEDLDLGVASAVTASVGVASGRACDLESIATRADQALYNAKDGGRNQVATAG